MAADLSAFLLDETYSNMLSPDEQTLRTKLLELKELRAAGARGSGWDQVDRLLGELSGHTIGRPARLTRPSRRAVYKALIFGLVHTPNIGMGETAST